MSDPDVVVPLIGDDQKPTEITFRAFFLSIILSLILSSANVYLGLFAGLTVSAAIPASVISMAILSFWKDSSILENNLVQTSASAGESIAAGVLFTIPALVIMGTRNDFDYTQTLLISMFGGALGVLFSIPLRRTYLEKVRPRLQFPEGRATAELLKAGQRLRDKNKNVDFHVIPEDNNQDGGHGSGGIGNSHNKDNSVRIIFITAISSAIIKLFDTGLTLWQHTLQSATKYASGACFYMGCDIAPALLGVGCIVEWQIGGLILVGGLINFLIAIPIRGSVTNEYSDDNDDIDYALTYWSKKARYLGCGAMVVGGFWALFRNRTHIWHGLVGGLDIFNRNSNNNNNNNDNNNNHPYGSKEEVNLAENGSIDVDDGTGVVGGYRRTQHDIPMKTVLILIFLALFPLIYIYYDFTNNPWITIFMVIYMIIAGFLFSAVAAYMAGVVGSSNNPVSGVTICTILLAALLLRGFLGPNSDYGPAASILIASTVCCACAISGDNMQDLAAGQILGATPWKLQLWQILGAATASFIQQPVLTLLLNAYGIGQATKEHPNPLSAPQATLMSDVAKGVFHGDLPWDMVGIGIGLAVAFILLNEILVYRKILPQPLPVLGFALGLYLPISTQVPIFLGGVVRIFIKYVKGDNEKITTNGILFSGGLITGEALCGVLLAIPIAASGDPNVLSLVDSPPMWPGPLILLSLMFLMFAISTGETILDTVLWRPCRRVYNRGGVPDETHILLSES